MRALYRLLWIPSVLVLVSACTRSDPDPEYIAAITEWQQGREERFASADGWLTVP